MDNISKKTGIPKNVLIGLLVIITLFIIYKMVFKRKENFTSYSSLYPTSFTYGNNYDKKENNECNSCVDYCSDVYNTKSNNFDACIEGCYQNSKVDCKKYYQTFDDFKEFYMKHKVTDNNCKS